MNFENVIWITVISWKDRQVFCLIFLICLLIVFLLACNTESEKKYRITLPWSFHLVDCVKRVSIALLPILTTVSFASLSISKSLPKPQILFSKIKGEIITSKKFKVLIFSEGYRRYLALWFTLFVRALVRFCFCVSIFLSKRPSL